MNKPLLLSMTLKPEIFLKVLLCGTFKNISGFTKAQSVM